MSKSPLERLQANYAKVAKLVILDPVYLPIFQRLEAELLAADTEADAIARARAVAARYRAS